MSCMDLFSRVAGDAKKAAAIDAECPHCACEAHSVSQYSPGPVGNDETIWRLILAPTHVDAETGKVKEMAFDDASNKGLSVQRVAAGDDTDDIVERGQARAASKPGTRFELAVGSTAGAVRALRGQDEMRFCIYDTANEGDPGHADVCQTKGGTKTERARLRRELQKQFSQMISASDRRRTGRERT